MKKISSLVILLFTGNCVLAQPVLTQVDFLNSSYIGHSLSDLTGITPGNAGANQLWDFSSINVASNSTGYGTTVPYSTAPGAANYPLANYCFKYYTAGSSTIYYDFSKLTNTGLETFGTYTEQGLETHNIDTQLMPLPLSYGDTYTDTYQTATSTPKTNIVTYDGFGTLITPFGTYTNVGRQKIIATTYNSTAYRWFQINPFTPLLYVDVNTSTNAVTSAAIFDANLAVNSNEFTAKISVFPNPTRSQLTIHPSNNAIIDKVTITDLMGKVVLVQSGNTTQVNVEQLASGLYILEAFSGEEKFTSKFVKE